MFSLDLESAPIEPYRMGETWSVEHEQLAYKWKKKCTKEAGKHIILGKRDRKRYILFGLPCMIIPAVFGPVCVLLEDDKSLPYVSMAGFILNGLFVGVTSFFGYSYKHQSHMEYAAIYGDIVTDIEYQLALSKKFREDPGTWLTRLQSRFDYTNKSAPDT